MDWIAGLVIDMDWIKDILYTFLMAVDAVIYSFAGWVYEIFEALAKLNLFDDLSYQGIVSKIYVILGIVMMFALAYSLLKAVINPENFAKGEQSFPKLVQNVVVSLIIIALLPTIFSFAFSFQNSIISQDTIGKLILGRGTNEESDISKHPGMEVSYYVLSSFFHVDSEWCNEQGLATDKDVNGNAVFDSNMSACAASIEGQNTDFATSVSEYLAYSTSETMNDNGNTKIGFLNDFTKSIGEGISYDIIISTVAGVFLLYVFVSFCFDVALRVFKLIFFQIIAPVPVICRIIPGGKMKDVFSTWMKKTVSTYLDVFIRIAVMYLGVYIIKLLVRGFGSGLTANLGLGVGQGFIARGFLILGVILFIKQAPKLFSEIFHLDSGSLKLGIKDKLSESGAFAAYAATRGGIAQGINNYNKVRSEIKNKKDLKVWDKAKNIATALKSGVGGMGSAAVRSGQGAMKAKSWKDANAAIQKGRAAAANAKARRDAYNAEHSRGGDFVQNAADIYIGGHVGDAIRNIGASLGFGSAEETLVADNKVIEEINKKKKAVSNEIESLIDKEANKSSPSFELGDFSASELRRLKLRIEDARAGNLRDARGNLISVAEVQTAYDDYRKKFSDYMQNFVLSQSNVDVYRNSNEEKDKKLYAKIASAYSLGEDLKETLAKNLDKAYVQEAGFTAQNVRGDLKVNDGPLDAIGACLDRQRANNDIEIARIRRENSNNNGNSGS